MLIRLNLLQIRQSKMQNKYYSPLKKQHEKVFKIDFGFRFHLQHDS